ncbi:MAG: hypothetical protein WD960_00690 [Gemmatimonadota bacterium]
MTEGWSGFEDERSQEEALATLPLPTIHLDPLRAYDDDEDWEEDEDWEDEDEDEDDDEDGDEDEDWDDEDLDEDWTE